MASLAIDANVFIYVLEQHSEFCSPSLTLLKYIEAGILQGYASELVYLEVLSNQTLESSKIATASRFLESSRVSFHAVDREVLLEAARLRRLHGGLKTPDAIHLATARLQKADYFVTNDHKLLRQKVANIELLPLAKAAVTLGRYWL